MSPDGEKPTGDEPGRLLTATEIAAMFGIGLAVVSRAIKEGKLRAAYESRTVRLFTEADALAWRATVRKWQKRKGE
ncbi:MAG: hypothetical protein KGL39_41845 [Patescibacteria group bacterium]|nr:hypothetical protein [Patescibacteria group bacterium]